MLANRLLCALLALMACSSVVLADTQVSGAVRGRWNVGGSPYIVIGALRVTAGNALVIDPGVEVRFSGNFSLAVSGRLQAEGTEGDSIRFYAPAEVGAWGGIRFFGNDSTSSLRFCAIEGGQALQGQGEVDSSGAGGNVFVNKPFVSITRCRIASGQARTTGGGIAFWRAGGLVDSCVIEGNQSRGNGGGIGFAFHSSPTVSHTRIVGNSASFGGGGGWVFASSNPTIENSAFIQNRGGDGENSSGGGLLVIEGSCPVVRKTDFIENTAQFGGGFYARGQATNPVVEWCLFDGNSSGLGNRSGGAAYLRAGTGTEMRFCRFINNRSPQGGAIYVKEPPRVNLHHNLFVKNIAGTFGGAIALSTDLGDAPVQIVSSTFIDNFCTAQEPVAHTGYARTPANGQIGSALAFNSCVIISQSPAVGDRGRVTAIFTNISGGYAGEGNSAEDPELFELDQTWGLLRGDSPCIDTGDPNLNGDADGTRIDRGWLYFPRSAFDGLPDRIEAEIDSNESVSRQVTIRNESGVPFYATVVDRYQQAEREMLADVSAVTNDQNLHAATYIGGRYFIAGEAVEQQSATMYVLDRQLRLVDTFPQPGGDANAGFIDLASEGDSIIFGLSGDICDELATDGRYIQDLLPPQDLVGGCGMARTSGEVRQFYFAKGHTIALLDNEFAQISRVMLPDSIITVAAGNFDRGAFAVGISDRGKYRLWQVPFAGRKPQPLYDLTFPRWLTPGGAEIVHSSDLESGKLVMLLEDANGGDRLQKSDLYTTWVVTHPEQRLLMPGEEYSWDITLEGSATPFVAPEYNSQVYFAVNGYGEPGGIPVRMSARQTKAGMAGVLPIDFAVSPAYPNPFNSSTTIQITLPVAGKVEYLLTDITGREVLHRTTAWLGAGDHDLNINGRGLASGLYIVKVRGAERTATRQVMLIR